MNHGYEPSGRMTAEPSITVVFQRTGYRNLKRYKLFKTKIVTESVFTIKMGNESLLRKSGVAIRKPITPKKRSSSGLPKPLTTHELPRKLAAKGTLSTSLPPRNGDENESDSD